MRYKSLRAMICLCLGFSLFVMPNMILAQEENITEISTLEELVNFRNAVNASTNYKGKKVVLKNDIDISSINDWAPIGNASQFSSVALGKSFCGVFDGQNHKIIGMQITSGEEKKSKGFFGSVKGGVIKNLVIENAVINIPNNTVGAFVVGMITGNGVVDNVVVDKSSVMTIKEGGGIVGRMLKSGTVQNCTNYANITASGDKSAAGGIVMKPYYTSTTENMDIINCKNYGNITATYAAGGISAFSAADIRSCYNSGMIKGGKSAGGIVGEQTNYGKIQNNSNSGKIAGEISGGIIGWIRYQINWNSYPKTSTIQVLNNKNDGIITGTPSDLSSSGGIVGEIYNQAIVKNNINQALEIRGITFASGIVGTLQKEEKNWQSEDRKTEIMFNVSTTSLNNIIGNCKNLFIYDNMLKDLTLVLANNATTLPEEDVPTLDPTKPVDKVEVGINDETSKQIVSSASQGVIEAVLNEENVDVNIVDDKTLEKIKEALGNGLSISTNIEIKRLEKDVVPAQDLDVIEETLKASNINKSEMKVAQYLDLGIIFKDNKGNDLGNLKRLDNKIKLSIMIPKELKVSDRKFSIIRVHDGKSEVLPTVVNEDGTLSFETDRFSTYALVYEDVVNNVEPPQEPEKPSEPSVPNEEEKPGVLPEKPEETIKPETDAPVDTGDNTDAGSLHSLLALSLFAIGSLIFKRKFEL